MDLVPSVIDRLKTGQGPTRFPGGIYDRPVAPRGRAATPDAFVDGELISCCSVSGSSADDPFGSEDAAIGTVTIWLRAPETVPGRTALRDNKTWVIGLLRGAVVSGPGLTGAKLRVADGIDVMPDPINENAVLTTIRFQAAGLWG
jgi:hypothetical protein